MSLFVPYEKMWDMPLGGVSKEKQVPHWVGNIIFGFLFVLFKICFRYRTDGLENLRGFDKRGGVVVISNHTSFLDTVFLYLTARPKQWIRLLGRESLFKNAHGLVGQILSRVGAFPIKRDAADLTAIKRAARMLKNKEVVGVFPEGTRRGKGSQEPELHSGAAFIARMGKAPLLPSTVRNAEYIKQKGKFFRFPQVSIEYGTPLVLSDFDFLPKDERLEACTWYAMRECFALSLCCPAEDIKMTELYPKAKDYTDIFREHPIPVHSAEELVGKDDGSTSKKEDVEK